MNFKIPKLKLKPRAKPVALSLYFGIPGAGKSTYAAYLAKKDMQKGRKVWSNFGITGALKCEKSDFGKYMMCDGRLIIDEAGLEYDNRKMSMTNDEIYFFKYHRHYQLDVDFFSQGLDVDIKIRKLARHIYLIKPSLLPLFIKRKEIGRKVGINDMTKEICDEYFFVPFLTGGTKLIFCPPLWKLFNTLSRKRYGIHGKAPAPRRGLFSALCATIETRGIRIYPLSLSLLFLPTVKDYPQISYPLRFIHAAA